LNGLPARLVFLYFVNADDMNGPTTEAEWHGASKLIRSVLGVTGDLHRHGVYDAYLDVQHQLDVP
jgi:hypothetical protein